MSNISLLANYVQEENFPQAQEIIECASSDQKRFLIATLSIVANGRSISPNAKEWAKRMIANNEKDHPLKELEDKIPDEPLW